MSVCLVQIISGLDDQSKFQMFTVFSGRHIGAPIWRIHTGLCKFVQNISTNISSLGRRTDLKLGEMTYLLISYNVLFCSPHSMNGSSIYIFIA